MSSNNEIPSTLHSATAKAPVYLDGEPIKWHGNPAHLEGALQEVGDYYLRNHMFQPLFQHRAALLNSGKMAIVTAHSIPFMSMSVSDGPFSFADPCPDAPTRVQMYNDAIGTPGGAPHGSANVTAPTLTNSILSTYIVSPFAVQAEIGRLHSSLSAIIADTTKANRFFQQSAGDGLNLLHLLRDHTTKATNTDRSLVISEYEAAASASPGALDETSLLAWVKTYERAKRHVPQSARKSDLAEVDLINILVYRDEGLREQFEIVTTARPPATLDDAVEAAASILRRRTVIKQIDDVRGASSGAGSGVSLAQHRALQAEHNLAKQALATAVNRLSFKPDATKNKNFKGTAGGTNGVKVPRDKDGRVTKWIQGMANCKYCNGPHLNRDCPKHPPTTSSSHGSSSRTNQTAAATHHHECEECDDDSSDVASLVAQINSAYGIDQSPVLTHHESNTVSHHNSEVASIAAASIDNDRVEALEASNVADAGDVVAADASALITAIDLAHCSTHGETLPTQLDPSTNASSEPHHPSRSTSRKRPREELFANDGSDTTVSASEVALQAFASALRIHAPHYFENDESLREPELRYSSDETATLHLLTSMADRMFLSTEMPCVPAALRKKIKELSLHLLMLQPHLPDWVVEPLSIRDMSFCPLAFQRLMAVSFDPPEQAWRLGIGLLAVCYEAWHQRATRDRLQLRSLPAPAMRRHEALVSCKPSTRDANIIEVAGERTGASINPKTGTAAAAPCQLVFHARIDSGCTAHATQHATALINLRSCDEDFTDANGTTARCNTIGDLPVWLMGDDGVASLVTIRNVRFLPTFAHTLLSVEQLWKEMHIKSQFEDARCLTTEDGRTIPFAKHVNHYSVLLCADDRPIAEIEVPTQSALAASGKIALGYHDVKSTNHIAKMSTARLGDLMHRRLHIGIDRIRAAAFNTKDGTKNLSSIMQSTCSHCAAAHLRRSNHPSTLDTPPPTPGILHIDLKELINSVGGYRYAAFFIDESTRYVFLRCLKLKSEIGIATRSVIAEFDAIVGVTVDASGQPKPRPKVVKIHSDNEGGLQSKAFQEFAAASGRHQTFSPPHDHDLNPIAERMIGIFSEHASAIRDASGCPPGFWPWLFTFVADVRNGTKSGVGSAPADQELSPHQRLTLRPGKLLDLATFGCSAVVLKQPTKQDKMQLSTRGAHGIFLGRTRDTIGSYDVLVDGGSIVSSSSVMVNEEEFPWLGARRIKPLSTDFDATAAAPPPAVVPTSADADMVASNEARSGYSAINKATRRSLHALNLFSGPYSSDGNLACSLRSRGWTIQQLDNDDKVGGGWQHDLLNDETFANLLIECKAGRFDAMMIGFPCSTFSASRFFTARDGTTGPPPVRNKSHPDGIPEEELDPKHVNELKKSNILLTRTISVAIAAHLSQSKTTIVFENPALRSDKSSNTFIPDLEHLHSTVFDTGEFKRLELAIGKMKTATFAYCRISSLMQQKYTTLVYTADASVILDDLNRPQFQCNHPRGSHNPVGGVRDADDKFTSARAAAYPTALNEKLADAFTYARTGSTETPHAEATATPRTSQAPLEHPEATIELPTTQRATLDAPEPLEGATQSSVSPRSLSNILDETTRRYDQEYPPLEINASNEPLPQGKADRPRRIDAQPAINYKEARTYEPRQQSALSVASDENLSGMELTIGELIAEAVRAIHAKRERSARATPVKSVHCFEFGDGDWTVVHKVHRSAQRALDGRWYAPATVDVSNHIASNSRLLPESIQATTSKAKCVRRPKSSQQALRADSVGAPETHKQVLNHPNEGWLEAEKKELGNHHHNKSWTPIKKKNVPAGRRIHKLVWVYKEKRDGTLKARLCVQGCTMESGVDYDQVFSPTIRYSSVRGLFAFAAQRKCGVRSVDLTAAYLQGEFEDGEVVYAHMAPGYEEVDEDGDEMCVRVEKPVYGIPQSGRRLHRRLRAWHIDKGFKMLDDSDSCVYIMASRKEILIVGIYVDNLQIVHSANIDRNGKAPRDTLCAEYMESLANEWDVVDEGPMGDMLGIEVERKSDGSILLNQPAYIAKLVNRFMPDGVPPYVQRNSTPYSKDFLTHINGALAISEPEYPDLIKPFQERVGSLMYSCSAVRPDIAYPVHQLCRCMHKPTPALMIEVDHVLAYLHRTAKLGLTFDASDTGDLHGYADASWEVNKSVSGYLVRHGSALLSYGSTTQKTVALSSCESEIVALSLGATELVYQRKWWVGVNQLTKLSPSDLYSDSKSARDVAYNPEHFNRMKHVARRHFYVRDMVEELEINVPYVKSDDNLADFLTKPLAPKRFHYLRSIIMNEDHRRSAAQ